MVSRRSPASRSCFGVRRLRRRTFVALPAGTFERAGAKLPVRRGERRPPAVRISRADRLRKLPARVGPQGGQRRLTPGGGVIALRLVLGGLNQGLDLVRVMSDPRF